MALSKLYEQATDYLNVPIPCPFLDFWGKSVVRSANVTPGDALYSNFFTFLRNHLGFYGDLGSELCPDELVLATEETFLLWFRVYALYWGFEEADGGWLVEVLEERMTRNKKTVNIFDQADISNCPKLARLQVYEAANEPFFVMDTKTEKGKGVFAGRNFHGGEIVSEYDGEIVKKRVSDGREKVYETLNYPVTRVELEKGKWLDANRNKTGIPFRPQENPARRLNHRRMNPNCKLVKKVVSGRVRYFIQTRRPVAVAVEMSWNYNASSKHHTWLKH